MTKFTSLGELLIAFRGFAQLSQTDLGAMLNVDNRTIIRWEKNATLLKADKEEELAEITFIPYQVIRNLNAPVSLPTYYDFELRKYANNAVFTELPHADWIKSLPPIEADQIQTITHQKHVDLVARCLKLQGKKVENLNGDTIIKASEIIPSLNFILLDNANFYSGHCIFLPLTAEAYAHIKNKELHPLFITPHHLDTSLSTQTVFFALDLNADCNENLFRLSAPIRAFFSQQKEGYRYASFTSRKDTMAMNAQFGNQLVWSNQGPYDTKPVNLFEKDTRESSSS